MEQGELAHARCPADSREIRDGDAEPVVGKGEQQFVRREVEAGVAAADLVVPRSVERPHAPEANPQHFL